MQKFKNSYCQIYCYESISVVHVEWNNKMAKSEGFIEACEYSLSLMKEKNIYKMIADNLKVSVVTRENQSWLAENWFPRAIASGFRFSAVVVPDDEFIKYTVKKIESKINNNLFTAQYFNSVEDAKVWLASL
jgi:hypothetical protein